MNLALKVGILTSGRRSFEVAALVGIDPSRLSAIVQGRATATPRERAAISAALNTDERRLFGETAAAAACEA